MEIDKLNFRDALYNPEKLSITWEVIPGKGVNEKSQENVLLSAEAATKSNLVNAITITDNPGGKSALYAPSIATEIKKLDIESLIHFTCKDRNRNAIQSELYGLERAGLNNILVMTGDYPTEGYTGRPKPVFDIDSVQTLRMIESMNQGEIITTLKGSKTLKPTHFFQGAVVSPFKNTEAELITQFYKLDKKIKNGAKFIVSQLGYDPRRFDELRKYMNLYHKGIPLIGSIFVLTKGIAKVMNNNMVPGCVVNNEMLDAIENDTPLLRSAKFYAILKGLKYDGINIGGHNLKCSDVEYIVEKGEELSKNWEDVSKEYTPYHKNGFYFFKKDKETNRSTSEPIDTSKTGSKKFSLAYKIFEGLHFSFFTKDRAMYKGMKKIIVSSHNNFMGKFFTGLEYWVKRGTHNCQSCGDCAMLEKGYICPMSQCPKQQRNGPCGGGFNGWCEVYPNKTKCIYVRAYERMKFDHKEMKLKDGYIKPCNWDFYRTSSWYNFYIGIDWQGDSD